MDLNNEKELFKKIDNIVKNNPVVLFMKGEKDTPNCGFSASVVNMLQNLKANFESVNILSNENLRVAVKKYSDWPTYPQLYVNGELIGGYDIVYEMYETGELKELLSNYIK